MSDKQCLGVYKIIYKQIPSKSCLGLIPAGRVRSTRLAGTKIALHSRICVCVCVCVRPQLSRGLSYVIPLLCHYSHERSGSYWKFAGSIGQALVEGRVEPGTHGLRMRENLRKRASKRVRERTQSHGEE